MRQRSMKGGKLPGGRVRGGKRRDRRPLNRSWRQAPLPGGLDYTLTGALKEDHQTVNVKSELTGEWEPIDLLTSTLDANCVFCGAKVVKARMGTCAHVVHHQGPCNQTEEDRHRR